MARLDARGIEVRAFRAVELDRLLELVREHARYERGAAAADHGFPRRLLAAALCDPVQVRIIVAVVDNAIVGYASMSPEFSTWNSESYLHLDCLYIQDEWRGRGIGRCLVDAVVEYARVRGAREVQWQTPEWNVQAIRFYKTIGARDARKRRFYLPVQPH